MPALIGGRAYEFALCPPTTEVIADALRHFGVYHSRPAAVRRGDRVFADEMNLLYYYRNRLHGYGIETAFDPEPPTGERQ